MSQRSLVAAAARAAEHLAPGRTVVLSGAGLSTRSGIPDYRSPQGSYSKGHTPMTHAQFIRSHTNRQRYWARSMAGWGMMARARPNTAHAALAGMEAAGIVRDCITQNVDRLHTAAVRVLCCAVLRCCAASSFKVLQGQRAVTELHGTVHLVKCLDCGASSERAAMQERMLELNQHWQAAAPAENAALRPDGDVEQGELDYTQFSVPACAVCEGVLKPSVVFFGANVRPPVVQTAFHSVDNSASMLVVGSSLHVYSGYRFVKRAAEQGKPIVIVNLGPTRADELPGVMRVNEDCSLFLPVLLQKMSAVQQGWAMRH
eukprot:TRINITY_DN1717_c0_g1_i3.p1 TRINITY_DN1717_c0_g1~~TRINITY_DN1717_c0_g1_i3.p1  ORF type:complete len:316 (+),score=76.64 TRINITY_DN1717_c0_g1_i3:167-1114(+)